MRRATRHSYLTKARDDFDSAFFITFLRPAPAGRFRVGPMDRRVRSQVGGKGAFRPVPELRQGNGAGGGGTNAGSSCLERSSLRLRDMPAWGKSSELVCYKAGKTRSSRAGGKPGNMCKSWVGWVRMAMRTCEVGGMTGVWAGKSLKFE